MKLALTIEPDRITSGILRVCRKLVPNTQPVFIPVDPEPGARANKCILNALNATRRDGGSVAMGWKVYVWPRVLADLIGHALVFRDGAMRCVTPSYTSEKKILFLPDPSLSFDENDPEARLGSKLIPLREDPDVTRFIDIAEEINGIKIKLPRTSDQVMVTGPDAERLMALQKDQPELIRRLTLRTKKPNEICICDSGRKFRKCCRDAMLRAGPY
jgi:hypothetical protein